MMVGVIVNAVIVIVGFSIYHYFRTTPSEIVHTQFGSVQGVIGWSRNDNQFSQYLGIPYATHERYEVKLCTNIKNAHIILSVG